jgi:hypothetical protein
MSDQPRTWMQVTVDRAKHEAINAAGGDVLTVLDGARKGQKLMIEVGGVPTGDGQWIHGVREL